MYKTNGEVNFYSVDTGERFKRNSDRVEIWNSELDNEYGMTEDIKKMCYEHTCKRQNLSNPDLVLVIIRDENDPDYDMRAFVMRNDIQQI